MEALIDNIQEQNKTVVIHVYDKLPSQITVKVIWHVYCVDEN